MSVAKKTLAPVSWMSFGISFTCSGEGKRKVLWPVKSGSITPPEPTHPEPIPEDIHLEVLYEDDYLAVINKPPDMVVHPAKGHWTGTLVNALRFRFDHLSEYNGDYRPGIVHRLDRDTSGAILVAKEEKTHRDLAMQFELRKVFKEYVALAAGVLDRDSDYIEGKIAHHPRDRRRHDAALPARRGS